MAGHRGGLQSLLSCHRSGLILLFLQHIWKVDTAPVQRDITLFVTILCRWGSNCDPPAAWPLGAIQNLFIDRDYNPRGIYRLRQAF